MRRFLRAEIQKIPLDRALLNNSILLFMAFLRSITTYNFVLLTPMRNASHKMQLLS